MAKKRIGVWAALGLLAAAPLGAAPDLGFAVRLYTALAQEPGSVCVSPASARELLAMAAAGARGRTAAEIEAAIGEPGPAAGTPAAGAGAELEVANAAFVNRGFPLLPSYQNQLAERFGAAALPLDFGDPLPSADAVNRWIADHTAGRIRGLASPGMFAPPACLVLADAVYFNGTWAQPFQPYATREQAFHPAAGREIRVPMMHEEGSFALAVLGDLQVLELPYRGGRWAMVVVLPQSVEGWRQLDRELTPALVQGWLDTLHRAGPQPIDLALPKFSLNWTGDLSPALRAMGIESAFTRGQADFGGISAEPGLFLSGVVQRSFIQVDEKGTEAAAVTLGTFGVEAIVRRPRFVADHPFLYLIIDEQTGRMLFAGRLLDPTQPPAGS